jgi:hypothetical protein
MSETLSDLLRRFRIETLVRQAEIIRDFPETEERTKEAAKLIYTVMYDHALGRLTHAEKAQILQTVDFARDYHAPPQDASPPGSDPLD